MEGAFAQLGNHLISDSASAINAGDDLSTIDADEAALDREYGRGNLTGGPRRRRNADDDETDVFDDDDLESLASAAVNGANGHDHAAKEEHVELPDHACAYVALNTSLTQSKTGLTSPKILRYPQPKQCRQVPFLQQVVLQRPREHFLLTYHQPLGESSPQGSPAASLLPTR